MFTVSSPTAYPVQPVQVAPSSATTWYVVGLHSGTVTLYANWAALLAAGATAWPGSAVGSQLVKLNVKGLKSDGLTDSVNNVFFWFNTSGGSPAAPVAPTVGKSVSPGKDVTVTTHIYELWIMIQNATDVVELTVGLP